MQSGGPDGGVGSRSVNEERINKAVKVSFPNGEDVFFFENVRILVA